MTNTLAIWLAVLIIGFFALDHYVLEWDAPAHIMRRLIELIDIIAVWR